MLSALPKNRLSVPGQFQSYHKCCIVARCRWNGLHCISPCFLGSSSKRANSSTLPEYMPSYRSYHVATRLHYTFGSATRPMRRRNNAKRYVQQSNLCCLRQLSACRRMVWSDVGVHASFISAFADMLAAHAGKWFHVRVSGSWLGHSCGVAGCCARALWCIISVRALHLPTDPANISKLWRNLPYQPQK